MIHFIIVIVAIVQSKCQFINFNGDQNIQRNSVEKMVKKDFPIFFERVQF